MLLVFTDFAHLLLRVLEGLRWHQILRQQSKNKEDICATYFDTTPLAPSILTTGTLEVFGAFLQLKCIISRITSKLIILLLFTLCILYV